MEIVDFLGFVLEDEDEDGDGEGEGHGDEEGEVVDVEYGEYKR